MVDWSHLIATKEKRKQNTTHHITPQDNLTSEVIPRIWRRREEEKERRWRRRGWWKEKEKGLLKISYSHHVYPIETTK